MTITLLLLRIMEEEVQGGPAVEEDAVVEELVDVVVVDVRIVLERT